MSKKSDEVAGVVLLLVIVGGGLWIWGAVSPSNEPAKPQKHLPISEYFELRQDIVACRDKEDFTRVRHLLAEKDEPAANALMAQYMMTDKCTRFFKGTTVLADEYSLATNMVQVRKKGEHDRWWAGYSVVAFDKEEGK